MTFRPGWFPEYTPTEQMVFDQIRSLIEDQYRSFGYAHIHTPAVESNKILLAKSGNETSKQIFWLYGLAQWWEDLKEYSLHFDLTIPFARYILDHEGSLIFPFKRYQTQPVWRGERAQRGRFREFRQCDIDTVRRADTAQSMILYDAETLLVIAQVFDQLKQRYFNAMSITIHYNDRKFLAKLLDHYPQKAELYSLFDKYYKIGKEKFEQELITLLGKDQAAVVLQGIVNPDKNPELIELEDVLHKMNTKWLSLVFDPFITRGLDYYTGMVYETFFDDDMALGSISSWWRYENLTTYIDPKRNFSGVGGSIGISRLVALILEKGVAETPVTTDYLCVNFSETFSDIAVLAEQLRQEEKKVEIYPSADKLGKQFAYADKKGIPYVVVLWEGEKAKNIYKIKHMKTGEETEYIINN